MDESYVVKKLLHAVPSKFLQIASTIEQFGDMETMTVEEVVGRLKAHEERLHGQCENSGNQLLLTQEEWLKRSGKTGANVSSGTRNRGGSAHRGRRRGYFRTGNGGTGRQSRTEDNTRGTSRDRSKVKCFNCNTYGHYASECHKPRRELEREKEHKLEANLTQVHDDEPALLLSECADDEYNKVLLNEASMVPQLSSNGEVMSNTNLWYLDNGASNHMTGQRSKFNELDENVIGQVNFGDDSAVNIKGKGTILMRCKNGEERLLREVYFIPNLCNNNKSGSAIKGWQQSHLEW